MTATALPAMGQELLRDGGAGFLRLESVDAAKNRFRFYTFTWQQTLWGEWAICCTWGRIGSLGRTGVAYLGHHSGLTDALPELVAQRLRHGYGPRSGKSERLPCIGAYLAARRRDSPASHVCTTLGRRPLTPCDC